MRQLKRLFATLLPRLTGTHDRSRVSILNYHRVLPERDPLRPASPCCDEFRWQMELLADYFQPISLSQALNGLRAGKLPERAVCVTFDDGYSDNALVAAPILDRLGIPATVFVATDFLDGGIMWNDAIIEFLRVASASQLNSTGLSGSPIEINSDQSRRRAAGAIIRANKYLPISQRKKIINRLLDSDVELPSDLMMSSRQLQGLAEQGIDVGAHTLSHPILAECKEGMASREISQSKSRLEDITGKPVTAFAYPNGKRGQDYTTLHCKMVRDAGFSMALTTNWGAASPSSDCFELPRFTPWDKSPSRFMIRLLMNYSNPQ